MKAENKRHRSKRGFTLVEIMMVMTISGFVSIGLAGFSTTLAKDFYWSANKSQITTDVRLFTAELSNEVRSSNAAYIYPNFDSANRDQVADRAGNNESGDCLLLVYSTPYPEVDDERHITDLVVYYRSPDQNGQGSVHRFRHSFSTENYIKESLFNSTYTIETVLSDLNTQGSHPEVVELSRGLANGRLFKSQQQGSLILVNAEIIHGVNSTEVTNTYNLTLAPRG